MKKDNEILKKGLVKTDHDFTSSIMQQINTEEQALSSVISKHGELETSSDFTQQLMLQLEGKAPKQPYAPVISRNAWVAIAAVFFGIIVFTISLGSTPASDPSISDKINNFSENANQLIEQSSWIVYVIAGVLIFSIALLFEQRVTRKRLH